MQPKHDGEWDHRGSPGQGQLTSGEAGACGEASLEGGCGAAIGCCLSPSNARQLALLPVTEDAASGARLPQGGALADDRL